MATTLEASAFPLSGQMEVDALLRPYAPWDFTTDNVIHYTFDPSAADDWLGYTNVHAYDTGTQDAARLALAHAAAITGITFSETADSELAELHFAMADIGSSGLFTASADWEVDASGNVTSADVDGYVVLHSSISNVSPGTGSYQLLLHELGHALGLKHPHDPSINLFPTEDNTDNTLMSYLNTGVVKAEFQEYDLAALDWIYGGDGLGGAGAFQDGVLRKFGTTSSETIVGGAGHDYLFGDAGDDTLIGGAGNDLLHGGSGADAMDGGEGDDRYVVSTGDVLTDSSGTEWVFSEVSWTLGPGFENLMLYASPWGTGETATGNSLDNLIAGNERDNVIAGGEGNDTLAGGSGLDRFVFAEAPGMANADVIIDFEFGWQDELVFDGAVFTALGETSFSNGDARFLAGPGASSGQDASDRLIYDTSSGRLYYDADGSGSEASLLVVTLEGAPALDGAQIEVLNGQEDEGMDITGTSGSDTLTGTSGDDTINALGGDDRINMVPPAYGSDTVDGGTGTDSLFFNYAGSASLLVDFGTGTAASGLGSVSFTGIERVVASREDDHLIGAAGTQNLSGVAGDDILEGREGNDILWGGGGADHFVFRETGTANADSIRDFAAASDMIVLDGAVMSALGAEGVFTAGGDGRFWAAAGATSGHDADDRVIYNTSTRQLFYDADGNGSGAAQLIATLQSGATLSATNIEVLGGSGGGDEIVGTEGDDTLVGTEGDDTIRGLGGNDTIDGRGGADRMEGGMHNDVFFVDNPGDDVIELEGGGSHDLVRSSITYALPAWVNDLTLTGTADIGGIGNELDNIITGNSAANFLQGREGNDTINGGAGNDHIAMHHGDFGPSEQPGSDSIDGGDGVDRIGFSVEGVTSTHAVAIDLGAGTYSIADPAGTVNGTVVNVEDAQGSAFADTIRGSGGANYLEGLSGDDLIEGLGGNDQLVGGFGHQTLAGGEGNDTLQGDYGAPDAAPDTFLFNVAPGAANADLIVDFRTGEDEIAIDGGFHGNSGASGEFAAGDARFAANATGTAQDSSDRVVYNTATGELWYDADGVGSGAALLIATLQGAPALAATDIEVVNGSGGGGEEGVHLVGTPGNDTLVGGPGDDTLEGLAGDDSLVGLEGNDILDGGAGFDTMDGGLGDDTYYADWLSFGFPRDEMIDAGGNDTVIASSGVLPDGIENFIVRGYSEEAGTDAHGNALDNTIIDEGPGNAFLYGNGGDDTLIGGDGFNVFVFQGDPSGSSDAYGHDTVDGGGGGDWLFFESNGSAVTVDFRDGTVSGGSSVPASVSFTNVERAQGSLFNDVMFASAAGNWLSGYGGSDILIGGAGNDVISGDSGFGHPTVDPGDDILEGGAGNDELAGEEGADSYVFRHAPGTANADAVFTFASGEDTIVLDGNAHADIGPSGDFAAGDARFRAGTSAQDADDRVVYNAATGELWYDADGNGGGAMQLIATLEGAPALAATDITVENGSGGGGTPGETIIGTSGNDTLTGTEGDDTIEGLSGNDTINMVAGASGSYGNDVVDGGSGSDSLFFNFSGAASVAVDFGAGMATSAAGSVAFSSIERVVATAGDDHLVGGAGSQNLSGVGGDDTLEGGAGNDILWSGGGEDHFVFRETGGANADSVRDFASGADTIDLDNAVMLALGAEGDFSAGDARFHAAAGASGGADASDRVIYNTSTGQLYYDGDGSAGGAAELIATISGAPSLAATDIAVI